MKTIAFSIAGNHENPLGNPIPFQRVLKQHYRAASKRYAEWCGMVRAKMLDALVNLPGQLQVNTAGKIVLQPGEEVEVTVVVTWADEKHGDLDNVVKGILDATLHDDKHVMAIDARAYHGRKGRVSVQFDIIKITQ